MLSIMLKALNHFTLRSDDLDRTAEFYHRLLGLAPGPRPPFAVPGQWLHARGRPLVHLLESTAMAPAGRVDHVAFSAYGRAAIESRLAKANVDYRLRALPDGSALQMFLRDPDGITLELVFRSKEDR
ncbi:MAG TPA: VOC family protein [Burkholderiaceae bacterium]|nr:VOC family protein [Burkholderiaceae bacterium]